MRAILLAAVLLSGFAARAQDTAEISNPVSYTPEQAEMGRLVFLGQCARCHGEDLKGQKGNRFGGEIGPPLKGGSFSYWFMRMGPPSNLYSYIFTDMPLDQPRTLAPADNAAVLAYILQANGFPSLGQALPADAVALSQMSFR